MHALGPADLIERPRPGEGIDRTPLPGQAAELGGCPRRLRDPGGSQRAGDVPAAADADDQDAACVPQGVGGGR
jgi:hypothetical protein